MRASSIAHFPSAEFPCAYLSLFGSPRTLISRDALWILMFAWDLCSYSKVVSWILKFRYFCIFVVEYSSNPAWNEWRACEKIFSYQCILCDVIHSSFSVFFLNLRSFHSLSISSIFKKHMNKFCFPKRELILTDWILSYYVKDREWCAHKPQFYPICFQSEYFLCADILKILVL